MKVIKINSTKKLFLYKTFLYRNVKFTTDSSEENMKDLVEALNIKKRNKRIEYIFDKCCDRIDEHNGDINMCGFCDGQCKIQKGTKYHNGCCRLCKYQSDKGCTTRNLSCKLFFCDDAQEDFEPLKFKDLPLLKLYTFRQRYIVLYSFFSSREQMLLDLKIGMIIFYGFGCFYRVMSAFVRMDIEAIKAKFIHNK